MYVCMYIYIYTHVVNPIKASYNSNVLAFIIKDFIVSDGMPCHPGDVSNPDRGFVCAFINAWA